MPMAALANESAYCAFHQRSQPVETELKPQGTLRFHPYAPAVVAFGLASQKLYRSQAVVFHDTPMYLDVDALVLESG